LNSRMSSDMRAFLDTDTQYLRWPFGLILGISQEWAERERSALLELVLARWGAGSHAVRRRYATISVTPKP
jgi:hypothetical protein